jgi:predicted outer membrane protein
MTELVLLATLLSGPLGAFGDLDRDDDLLAPAPASSPEDTDALPSSGGDVATTEAVGAGVLHLINRIAIASARIAEARSPRVDIRAFASSLIVEHQRAERGLQSWLSGHERAQVLLKAASPRGNAGDLRLPGRLRKAPARSFDRTYVRATLAMQSRGLRFIEAVRMGVKDLELERLLDDMAALLQAQQGALTRLLAPQQDGRSISEPDKRPQPGS